MTKLHGIPETKTHESLLAERGRITETRDQLDQSVLVSTEAAASKIRALNEVEKSFIHGQATAPDIDRARLEAEAANSKLVADKRLLALADNALKEIGVKITESGKHLKNARYAFCMTEHGRILAEINADQELQKKLVECFAAYRANGWRYSDDWQAFMDSLAFVKPNQAMIDEAVEKFHQMHKLDRQ